MNYGNGLVASTVCESGYVLLSTAQNQGQIQFKRNKHQTKQADTSLSIAVRHRQACHGCAGGSNASLQLRSCRLQFPAGAEWSWAGLGWRTWRLSVLMDTYWIITNVLCPPLLCAQACSRCLMMFEVSDRGDKTFWTSVQILGWDIDILFKFLSRPFSKESGHSSKVTTSLWMLYY